MVSLTGQNGMNLPFNRLLSSGYTASQFYRYNFGQGLSYSYNSGTMRDMYANANGTVRNQSPTLYYPDKCYGMYYLNNTSGYSASNLGNTLQLGVNTSNDFTVFVAWEYVASNLTYGADIIMGAYQGSTHDWWLGQNGYSATTPYWVSRNGTGLTQLGTAPVVGRRYIACYGNSVIDGKTYWRLWDSAGGAYSTGNTTPAVNLNTAGVVAVGKYGGWNDNYMPRIYVGEAWYCTYLPIADTTTMYNFIKTRYGAGFA